MYNSKCLISSCKESLSHHYRGQKDKNGLTRQNDTQDGMLKIGMNRKDTS